VPTLNLALHVAHLPHVGRMRQRVRRLPAQRPSRLVERWYTEELTRVVRLLDQAAHSEAQSLRSVWPGGTALDAHPVDDVIARIAHKFGGIDLVAERLAKAAAQKSLQAVDARAIASIRKAVGVDISGALSGHGHIADRLREFHRWNVQLIKSIPEEYLGRLGAQLGEAWEHGRRWEDLAQVIDENGDVSDSRARLIARDQTSKMNAAFTQVRMQDVGINRYRWSMVVDGHNRPEHLACNGQEYSYDEPGPVAGSVDGEPCHAGEDIECLPGGAILSPSLARVIKVYRRSYAGELTKLVMAGQRSLAATPNHPVLTGRGWIPIQFVDVGEDVFQAGAESVQADVRDPKGVQATALEFFGAISALFVPQGIAGTATGFHGDGSDQQVDIVDVDGGLWNEGDPPFSQEFCEHLFALADEPSLSTGALELLFERQLVATDSLVRGGCKTLALLAACAGHPQEHAITAVARLDAMANEIGANGGPLDAKAFRELLHTDTGEKEGARLLARILLGAVARTPGARNFDSQRTQIDAEVVGIHAQGASGLRNSHPLLQHPMRVLQKGFCENAGGHVYNLQTSTGWYVAQETIIRNCRCWAEPVVNLDAAEQEQEQAA
jgi:SPP1 gp7 family putative phage head morphogenesis protein